MHETDGGTRGLLETRLRVVTWNLWWQFGPWQERAPAIEETLRRLDPDVVALQEVWDDEDESSASRLAAGLGYEHVVGTRREWGGVWFGNAVLSRWPIAGSEVRPLPAPPDAEEYRCVVRADVDGPRGPLQVFSTHLNWRFDQSHIRQDQVRAVCRFVRESPERSFPPVVCGDFNAVPDSDEIGMMTGRRAVPEPGLVFHDAWEVAGGGGPGFTWSNDNPFAFHDLEPNRRIDYVFAGWPKARGAGHVVRCEVVGIDPVGGIHPSDHYAVLAELRY
jgi:endonuclease/exonuclease/phosphatase family metal-dependent hydrolase